ncbi:MAG: phosphoglucosamine mutase [Solirubrobacterales bacterium]
MGALFGTDGVRGVAGEQITADLALALGRAAVAVARRPAPQILLVRDTRESGPMLESALAAGIASAGGEALIAGVLPTPAASVLVRRHGLDLAAVISASHNPFADNGIKFFGPDGGKLGDDREATLERLVLEGSGDPAPPERFGRIREIEAALADYVRALRTAFPLDLTGRRILLDCANGATYQAAPLVFERLGATVEVIADEPDGRNINEGCGSTHVEALAAKTKEAGADVGFAFDGDGDRVLAADRSGRVHDGDELIALCARHLQAADRLGSGGVAVTVMTNYGFHQAMADAAIPVATTKVGDRHVTEELRRRDWTLGGEQSGHIISTDFAATGDGIAAALLTLAALGNRDLAEVEPFVRLPQTLVNVRVADREAVADAGAVWDAVAAADAALEGRGRVLIRPSGTEPLVRVMVEAPTAEEAERTAGDLAALVVRELG